MVISLCNEVEYIFLRHEPWKKLHLRRWLVIFSFFFAGLVGWLVGWLARVSGDLVTSHSFRIIFHIAVMYILNTLIPLRITVNLLLLILHIMRII